MRDACRGVDEGLTGGADVVAFRAFLRRGVVEVVVGLELECEVGAVDEEEND